MTGASWRYSAQYRAEGRGSARRTSLLIASQRRHRGSGSSARAPLARHSQSVLGSYDSGEEEKETMQRPMLSDLKSFTPELARAYMKAAKGDELAAAIALANDRNALDGSHAPPDDAEVHHALFLLRRAQGLPAPSFDDLRVALRQRAA